MPKMLSDNTEIKGYGDTKTLWKVMKKFAMKPLKTSLENTHWFKPYDEPTQQLIRMLIEAQRVQGGDPTKDALVPVPNPLASPDEFDPFKNTETEEEKQQREQEKLT